MLCIKCYLVVNVVNGKHLKIVEFGGWRLEICQKIEEGKGMSSRYRAVSSRKGIIELKLCISRLMKRGEDPHQVAIIETLGKISIYIYCTAKKPGKKLL